MTGHVYRRSIACFGPLMIFPSPDINGTTDPTRPQVDVNHIIYYDKAFEEAFVKDRVFFGSLDELTKCVDIYEHISQQRIKVFNSDYKWGFRQYTCTSEFPIRTLCTNLNLIMYKIYDIMLVSWMDTGNSR